MYIILLLLFIQSIGHLNGIWYRCSSECIYHSHGNPLDVQCSSLAIGLFSKHSSWIGESHISQTQTFIHDIHNFNQELHAVRTEILFNSSSSLYTNQFLIRKLVGTKTESEREWKNKKVKQQQQQQQISKNWFKNMKSYIRRMDVSCIFTFSNELMLKFPNNWTLENVKKL